MSVPRSAAAALRDHVTPELESIDRMYLYGNPQRGDEDVAWKVLDSRPRPSPDPALPRFA